MPTNANGGAAASLKLQGLGIGGFGQSVILLGGGTHTIQGNQFGGIANGVDLGTTSLNIISIGGDAANNGGSVTIGGFGPERRNVIGGALGGFGNGINIQSNVASSPDHCVIDNNWIGLAPDLTPLPNTYGVQLSGSGCAVTNNRLYGNVSTNLWINGGSNNIVQGNIISDTSGLPNDAFGIRIEGDRNRIGSPDLPAYANAVTDMSKGGIVVLAGAGNVIRGNYVAWNGPNHDGLGMDIDLGGDGPSPNLTLGAGSGPNNWQPFPEIDALSYLDHPQGAVKIPISLQGHLDAATSDYLVDAYLSDTCSPTTGRAHAQAYLGSTVATVPVGQTLASFTMQAEIPSNATGYLALTATREPTNGTSEIGPCYSLDRVFDSGFGSGTEY